MNLEHSKYILSVEGPMGSGKTHTLIERAVAILKAQGSEQTLILCATASRKQALADRLLRQWGQPIAAWPIVYTYSGFVRNVLFDLWPFVEETLAARLSANRENNLPAAIILPAIRPALYGMEDSAMLLHHLIQRAKSLSVEDPFIEFRGNDSGLVRQFVRRLRLRSENRLSRPDMTQRSRMLKEPCQEAVSALEKQFDWFSFTHRILDPNKQMDVFHGLLEKHTGFRAWMQNRVKHLLVDDVDETIPAVQQFIELVSPSLQTLVLTADMEGGSRRGYLNAYPYDWQALNLRAYKKMMLSEPIETRTLTRRDAMAENAETLLKNWLLPDTAPKHRLNTPPLEKRSASITRVEMLDTVVMDLQKAFLKGYAPGDCVLVIPKADLLDLYPLQMRLKTLGVPIQLLSGTRKPTENSICQVFLLLIQLVNATKWQQPLSPLEWQHIVRFAFPALYGNTATLDLMCQALQEAMKNPEFPLVEELKDDLGAFLTIEAQNQLIRFRHWYLTVSSLAFRDQLYKTFSDLVAPCLHHNPAVEPGGEEALRTLSDLMDSFERYGGIQAALATTYPELSLQAVQLEAGWLQQVKRGGIANTPEMPDDIQGDALVLATPQKVIDSELRRPLQFWLDIGSREWCRTDQAPLYNAWVHSPMWDLDWTHLKETYSQPESTARNEALNRELCRARAGHLTRTLMLLAQEQVNTYQCELDDEGNPQTGWLPAMLPTQTTDLPVSSETLIPSLRSDQQPILTYQKGTMAVSAVPGAGKTFVNVALILNLMLQGIPASEILVITFMDSAAKTLFQRLKRKLAGSPQMLEGGLPMISTIHSLAYRILVENDHGVRLGLDMESLAILDEVEREGMLMAVAWQTYPGESSFKTVEQWAKFINSGLQYAKSNGVSPSQIRELLPKTPGSNDRRIRLFLPAYERYQETLKRYGKLDFTDLILSAVQLLEAEPDIREAYQQKFSIIIEDEAQDSSCLLQRLIYLLAGDSPNIVRTGDTNQSITTTFSAADPEVFRSFIHHANHHVFMTQSGRCAPEILALANQWMTMAGTLNPQLAEAFHPQLMEAIPEVNPSLLLQPEIYRFSTEAEEKQWLATHIASLQNQHPGKTVAVLLRQNKEVQAVTGALQQAGIAAVSLSESLPQSAIFLTLTRFLKLLAYPNDGETRCRLYRAMREARVYDTHEHGKARSEAIENFLQENNVFHLAPVRMARQDEFLIQLYYDWQDFSRDATGRDIPKLIIRLTDRLFRGNDNAVEARSNGYLCAMEAETFLRSATASSVAPTISMEHTTIHASALELLVGYFDRMSAKGKGRKSLMLEPVSEPASLASAASSAAPAVVQVMTLHKAKGQEFDIVYLPNLSRKYYPHQLEDKRLEEGDKLILDCKRLMAGNVSSTTQELDAITLYKRSCLAEEARLLYVGITRAKRGLFLSVSEEAGEPALILKALQEALSISKPPLQAPEAEVEAYA